MKRQCLASSIIASIVCTIALTDGQVQAEEIYRINGKAVPANVYKAARLVQEANIQIADNNLVLALSKLKRALIYDPGMPIANGNLGIILARQGKNAEALQHLKKATKSADSPPFAFVNLASFYQTTGNIDGAISTMKEFIGKIGADSPLYEQAKDNLAVLEKEKQRRQEQGKNDSNDNYYSEVTAKHVMRWTEFRMPLRVFIKVPVNLEGYKDHYDGILKQSFIDWEKNSKKTVSFIFVSKKEDSDIDCFWTDDLELLGKGTENGHTEMRSLGGALQHSSIALRAKEMDGSFPFSDNSVAMTCRHEVGHALGLSGHSSDPADLMFFSVPLADSDKPITARDRNTLQKLYSTNVSAQGICLDFIFARDNLKKYAPLFALVAIFVAVLTFILRSKKKKTKSKQNRKK